MSPTLKREGDRLAASTTNIVNRDAILAACRAARDTAEHNEECPPGRFGKPVMVVIDEKEFVVSWNPGTRQYHMTFAGATVTEKKLWELMGEKE